MREFSWLWGFMHQHRRRLRMQMFDGESPWRGWEILQWYDVTTYTSHVWKIMEHFCVLFFRFERMCRASALWSDLHQSTQDWVLLFVWEWILFRTKQPHLCRFGFIETKCLKIYTNCPFSLQLKQVLAFLDVNECVAATCAGFCEEEEIGSYKCGCYAGYILHSDGRSCIGQSFFILSLTHCKCPETLRSV